MDETKRSINWNQLEIQECIELVRKMMIIFLRSYNVSPNIVLERETVSKNRRLFEYSGIFFFFLVC